MSARPGAAPSRGIARGRGRARRARRYARGRARAVVVLAPILEVNSDTMPATLQYDVADPRQPSRILGELGRGRFTVRLVAPATQRARRAEPKGTRPNSTHAYISHA